MGKKTAFTRKKNQVKTNKRILNLNNMNQKKKPKAVKTNIKKVSF